MAEENRRKGSTRGARKRRQRQIQILFWGFVALVLIVLCSVVIKKYVNPTTATSTFWEGDANADADYEEETLSDKVIAVRPELDVQLLTINEYSRPGTPVSQINSIVIHYTANPGASAQDNRDYFESLAETGEASVSSNFIVGIEGEIIQCIPSSEVAYASNKRNYDSLSIEVCHLDETGEFTDATYNSLVEFVAWLCGEFEVKNSEIIRHYDVTGKECPLYYVENEDEWIQFKKDVANYIETYGVLKSELIEETY